jgi:signal transduction histidine kinase
VIPAPGDTTSVRRFLRNDLVAVGASSVILVAVYGAVVHDLWLLGIVVALAAVGVALVQARRLLDAGNVLRAIGVLAAANWTIALFVTAVAPVALNVTPLVALIPTVLAIPFLDRRRFAAMAAGSVALSFALVLAGRLYDGVGLEEDAPAWVEDGFVIVFTPLVVGFLAFEAWENHLRVARQADQLRTSRARLVTATDRARQQLERDLHDGAQQRLLAITVQLRVLQQLLQKDPDQAIRLADQLIDDMQAAMDAVRDIAHGIYPPELSQHGLDHAIREVARRAPRPVAVHTEGVGRYDAEIEATAYFFCLEAVQNVIKHAGDTTAVTIRLDGRHRLHLVVEDDGVGFDPAVTTGRGLDNMNDRIAAHDGTVTIAAAPGRGTTVHASIPLPRSR